MSQGYDQFFKQARKAKNRAENKQDTKKKLSESEIDQALRRALIPKEAALQRSKRRGVPKSRFPWISFSLCLVCLLGFAFLSFSPGQMEKWMGRVQVGWLKGVQAADQEANNPHPGGESGQKSSGLEESSKTHQTDEKREWSEEDLNHFSQLARRKRDLDQREKNLNKLEEELHKQKVEIDARLKQLQETRRQIAGVLQERVEMDKERVDRLVEFYSNMRPQQAAQIIETLNDDLAVEILGNMKRQNAAEIMNVLDPEKAQILTEKFAGYKR